MLLSFHMRNSEHFDPHPLLVCMANCQFVGTLCLFHFICFVLYIRWNLLIFKGHAQASPDELTESTVDEIRLKKICK